MSELQKAKLQEVSADENQTPIGDPVQVQFNPTSLKLKLSNQSDGGRSRGRQRRQNNGQSSTVLSMELVFDSADEGTAEAPVSVRTKTRAVEKFVLPKEDGGETPPRLQFEWDKLIIAGIVESLDIDFDHFAENGAPLRARMSLSIKEQEPKYTASKEAKGSGTASKPGGNNATNPGGGTNEPGAGNKSSDRSATALDGESAPEFLARQGLDPSAWRGLDIDLSAGLSFEAGIEVGFSAGLSVSAGVGASFGAQASAGVSLEASLGLNVGVGTASSTAGSATGGAATAGSTASTAAKSGIGQKVNGDSAGRAIAAAGGVQAAIASVKMQQAQSASTATQSAFGLPAASSSAAATAASGSPSRASAGSGSQSAAGSSAASSSAGSTGATGALKAPMFDVRASSFGFGVPLRPQYAAALSQTNISLCQHVGQSSRGDGGPVFARQKTTAPWVQLPPRNSARALADTAEFKKRRHPCDYTYHPCDCEGD